MLDGVQTAMRDYRGRSFLELSGEWSIRPFPCLWVRAPTFLTITTATTKQWKKWRRN